MSARAPRQPALDVPTGRRSGRTSTSPRRSGRRDGATGLSRRWVGVGGRVADSRADPPDQAVRDSQVQSGRGRSVAQVISRVGVVGLGTMGAGIVEVFARSGLEVTAVEVAAD